MTKIKTLLLASTIIPACALVQAGTTAVAQSGERIILAQQQQQVQDPKKKPVEQKPTGRPAQGFGNQGTQGKPQTTTTPTQTQKPQGFGQTGGGQQGKPQTTTTPQQTQKPVQGFGNQSGGGQGKPATTTAPVQTQKPVQGFGNQSGGGQGKPATTTAPVGTQKPGQGFGNQNQPGGGQGKPQQTTTPVQTQKPVQGFGTQNQQGGGQPGKPQQGFGNQSQSGQQNQTGQQGRPQGGPQFGGQPKRFDDLRKERQEIKEGNRTIIKEADRTIIRENGRAIIRHDELARFRGPNRDFRIERRGNENFAIMERPGGVRIITVTDADGRLIRRIRRDPSGREFIIIDNTYRGPRPAGGYFVQLPPPVIRIPRERYIVEAVAATPVMIYEALMAPPVERLERRYTLDEIRYSEPVRARMPRVDIDTINFDTGSWEVTPDQAARLAPIAEAILRAVGENPNEVFMVEGHTDAVGSEEDNLSLSDRRAQAVAQVLTEQFQVPPENLTTQGYGEQNPKVPVQGPSRENRRVTVLRITPLLEGQQQN